MNTILSAIKYAKIDKRRSYHRRMSLKPYKRAFSRALRRCEPKLIDLAIE